MKKHWETLGLLGTIAIAVGASACAKKDHGAAFKSTDSSVQNQQIQEARRASESPLHPRLPQAPAAAVTGPTAPTGDGAATGPTAPTGDAVEQPALTESYFGPRLALVYPSHFNFGYIHLDPIDSKALYHVLAVKTSTEPGNATWGTAHIKRAPNVKCFKQATRANPSHPQYACSMYLDYKTGGIDLEAMECTYDPSVRALKQSFFGRNLTLIAGDKEHAGSIRLLGTDAEKLYGVLDAEVSTVAGDADWEPTRVKKAGYVSCFAATRKGDTAAQYSCVINLDYRNGEVSLER